jgi:hypothetical protein
MSKKEGKKFTVTPGSVDEKSFDLDLDGEEYMGGSYLVKDNGDIVNVAAGNEVYGNVNQLEEGEAAYEYEKGKKAGEKMKKSELKAKIKEQTSQFKKYDKVNYDGEENLIVNILYDEMDENIVLVPMSEIDDEAFSVDSDEISNPKIYNKINYDGEKHLIVNILKDGGIVLVPMYVIDNEAFSVSENEIEPPVTENVKTKMKKSELKAKIKEMIVSEMNIDVTDETEAYDFLAEIEDMLDEESKFDTVKKVRIAGFIKALDALVDEYHAELYLSDDLFAAIEMAKKAAMDVINLNEAEGDEEVDVDVETADDTTTVDVSTDEVDPNVKAVQDALTQAQAAAQDLNDPKLSDQIGNTITFFTRSHIVKKPGGAVTESMSPMLKKILK